MNQYPNPIELIKSFVEDKLDGDIDALSTYPLYKLWGDKKYGNPDRNFDGDDTELMRAIYCVVFKDTWKGLTMDTLADYTFRGDTINTYATMFGRKRQKEQSVHPGIDKFHPSEELSEKIMAYNNLVGTIGNMMVLPNKTLTGLTLVDGKYQPYAWTLNQHRGMHPLWQDYQDRFLCELYKVLTDRPDKDLDLAELVEANNPSFLPYYGEDGWKAYIKNNMLEGYCDLDYKPQLTSKGYTFWRNCYVSPKNYLSEAERFVAFASCIIEGRAQRIIQVLKDKCFE